MAISIRLLCDECGSLNAQPLTLATGYVLIDGEDAGQSVDLCPAHWPIDQLGKCQPHKCRRVVFVWPGNRREE